MSSGPRVHPRYSARSTELCISHIGRRTKREAILAYFEQFGKISEYTFSSATNGHLFLNYATAAMVNVCMQARPHKLDGRLLYVKRSLPRDEAHPRERFEESCFLMIIIDFDHQMWDDPQFLAELREYFSFCAPVINARRYREANFDCLLLEYEDTDSVDQVILEKPHRYNEHVLDVMKYILSNVELTNRRYASNPAHASSTSSTLVNAAVSDNSIESRKSASTANGSDVQREVYRLQEDLTHLTETFARKHKQLDAEYSERFERMNASITNNRSRQEDFEREHAQILADYDSLKEASDALHEQYLSAELENFEITPYYEQILEEMKAETARLETIRAQKLQAANSISVSASSAAIGQSPARTVNPSQD